MDVLLRDAAGAAPALQSEARRREPCATGRAAWRGVRRRRAATVGAARPAAGAAGCRATAAVADLVQIAEHSPTLTSSPSWRVMLRDDTGALGADLEVDLLGLELDQRLAQLDAVALLLQPVRDARFDDRLAEFRDDDVGHRCADPDSDLLRKNHATTPATASDSRGRTPARRAPSDSAGASATIPPTGSSCARGRCSEAGSDRRSAPRAAAARIPTRPCSPALPAPRHFAQRRIAGRGPRASATLRERIQLLDAADRDVLAVRARARW